MRSLAAVASLLVAHSQAQCSSSITPTNGIQPSVASGYSAAVIATGLTDPRSLEFDSADNLLVLEAGKGVSSHVLDDGDGTCISVKSSKDLISDEGLDHGIALSKDGATLYVSDSDKVYAYTYDAKAGTVGDDRKTVVFGMQGADHVTRTLLIPEFVENMMVVSRGSTRNIDDLALDEDTGVSQVRAFDLSSVPDGGYNYTTSGTRLGWGLRNEVGIAEGPDGGIWGVENSADQLNRSGVDVHATNPGEELNWLGYLNGTTVAQQGSNFGYPTCFSVWDVSVLPDPGNLTTGMQFALDSDVDCSNYTSSRLVFHPHTAPLDIKFNDSGSTAWVSFHGSWNSPDPVGYHVGYVNFENGQPTAPSTSNDALTVILANQDNSKCPDGCFRPAGIRFDKKGRLLVASDASGEIYVVQRTTADTNSTSGNATQSGGGGSPTTSGAASSPSTGTAALVEVGSTVMGAGLIGLFAMMIGLV